MNNKVYGIWFNSVTIHGPIQNVHPYVYLSHAEAVDNAKTETRNSKECSYEVFELEIFESNSVNFIRREDS